MAMIQLSATETVAGKPFTDLRYTCQDEQAIRFMIACLTLTLESLPPVAAKRLPVLVHHPCPERWIYRLVITQPKRLQTLLLLTVVGFFGLKSRDANVSLAQELDQRLIPELSNFDALLAYVSLCLPTGNFANLVVFASPTGKDEWGRSEKHAEAVRLLTPDYYSAVRLYNGQLPRGIAHPDAVQLSLVKYYDYQTRPMWRAVRPLTAE